MVTTSALAKGFAASARTGWTTMRSHVGLKQLPGPVDLEGLALLLHVQVRQT